MANVNPPQPGPQLGPQPNFELLTQGLQHATAELGKFANLPPFAQGAALIQQMQQMQQQMQQMQQQTQQMQQMQQQTQQDFVNVRNDIQTLRNDIRTNHRAA
jgi:septal ring factor EnvC (AmiA/AmiB activator)